MTTKPSFILFLLAILMFACNNQENKDKIVVSKKESTDNKLSSTVSTSTIINADTTQSRKQKVSFSRKKTPKKIVSTISVPSTISGSKAEFIPQISLSDVYKHFQKKNQTFRVSVSGDTTIYGEEGTKITIPANSFIVESTGESAKGNIDISIEEYYKLSDIILARLSTTSNGDLLETGGMIHILASQDGKKCSLKEGQQIKIAFPYTSKKDSMELFNGHWNNNTINWNHHKPNTRESILYTTSNFTDYELEIFKQIYIFTKKNVKYPYSALKKKVKGNMNLSFELDKSGNPRKIFIENVLDSMLDKSVYYTLNKFSKKPIKFDMKTNSSFKSPRYSLSIHLSYKPSFIKRIGAKRLEKKIKDVQVVYADSLNKCPIKMIEDELHCYNNTRNPIESISNDSTLQKSEVADINSYLLKSSQLGWINCDRFADKGIKKINFSVQTNDPDETAAEIVFHDIKCVMESEQNNNELIFREVPKNRKVTLVAFKVKNNKVLLAMKETTIQKAGETLLDFQPVTMEKLKSEIEKLNSLN